MTTIEFLGHVFDINGKSLIFLQRINELPESTSVKGFRSFIGMDNYFRDFIKGLSSHMIPLTALTKTRSALDPFKMTSKGRAAFTHIKRLLAKSSQFFMNEKDPLILHTYASLKAIIDALIQLQN